MTTQDLQRENAKLRILLHIIGIEAMQALDWSNEETWKNALQRIADLARGEEQRTMQEWNALAKETTR